MALPTYDEFIAPLLQILAAQPAGMRAPDAHEAVAALVGLSDEAKAALLPSGRQPVYKNRIGWLTIDSSVPGTRPHHDGRGG